MLFTFLVTNRRSVMTLFYIRDSSLEYALIETNVTTMAQSRKRPITLVFLVTYTVRTDCLIFPSFLQLLSAGLLTIAVCFAGTSAVSDSLEADSA